MGSTGNKNVTPISNPRTSITIACLLALAVFASTLSAQEPASPTFDANAKLVLVPFHVQRGKYFAADLQPSDFILREDGHPRPFNIFEGPNTPHPLPLELILLFDTTAKVLVSKDGFPTPAFGLDPKSEYEFLNNWDESITREVLQKKRHGYSLGALPLFRPTAGD